MEIIDYVQSSWVAWFFMALFAILGYCYRRLLKRLDKQIDEYRAVLHGLKFLLKQRIIDAHNKYTNRGYCPIYAKESLKEVYQAYHDLGGNDVATGLFEELLEMPVKGEDVA